MVNLLSDYIESDYAPMPYMDSIWLPKCFNDRKHLIAYVRKSTRNGIWLTNDICLPVWQSVKNAKKAGIPKKKLHEIAEYSKQSNHLVKYASMFQKKLIEVEYDGVIPSRNQSITFNKRNLDEANQAPRTYR